MLFNTYAFALIFLPVALAGYFLSSRYSLRASILFLLSMSVFFYSYWDVDYLPLLACSIACNYCVCKRISRERDKSGKNGAKLTLILGLAFNLGLLGFFKYADFFGSNISALMDVAYHPFGIRLPIGISFFTFTQIAYLVDCYVGKVREYRVENYGLFVTYFPHLIAGPIIHHKDMMPQFEQPKSHVFIRGRLVIGMTFFLIGLIKKIVLADGVARFVGPVFDLNHGGLTMLEAWCGALAYTFQLYFDFSAYSDMAYGLSYMFGIVLPVNFNSPYKAGSIIEFWRRWHITLSTFLRDYLYIPLGGNRKGGGRRYANLLVTMLLGGLWHGADWTFVFWGGLHGMYLIANHALRRFLPEKKSLLFDFAGWIVTFLAIVVAWVFFRASSMRVALDVLHGMLGGTLAHLGSGRLLGINRIMAVDECLVWLTILAGIAFLAPNAYDLLGKGIRGDLEGKLNGLRGGVYLGLIIMAGLLLLTISETRGVSEFLYFNF